MLITGVDVETTGLDQAKGDRIIEVAMVSVEVVGDRYIPKHKFVQRIDPQRPIHPDALAVHGINYSELIGCPTWDAVAPKVQDMLSKTDLLVAHNMDFDGPFIAGELLRVGLTPPNLQTFCTMTNARWATPTGKLPKLQELCFSLAVDYDPAKAHAAEYDVLVMLQCLKRGVKRRFFQLP